MPESTFTLTFNVPEIDFDAAQLDAAMLWIKAKVEQCTTQDDEIGGISAYNLLKIISDRYMDALGKPEWKMPPLTRRL